MGSGYLVIGVSHGFWVFCFSRVYGKLDAKKQHLVFLWFLKSRCRNRLKNKRINEDGIMTSNNIDNLNNIDIEGNDSPLFSSFLLLTSAYVGQYCAFLLK